MLPQTPNAELLEALDANHYNDLFISVRTLLECSKTRTEIERPEIIEIQSLKELPKKDISLLRSLNLITPKESSWNWNFDPVLHEDVLLFRDHARFSHLAEYVWLHPEKASSSWSFSNELTISPGMRILDLGTGSGLNAILLRKRGADTYGIDVNPRAIALAKLNGALNGMPASKFQVSCWEEFTDFDWDLVISQPPFDPIFELSSPTLAFGGGDQLGLQHTKAIMRRFMPRRHGQELLIYTHGFSGIIQRELLHELSNHGYGSCAMTISPIKSYSIEEWWNKYRMRHHLSVGIECPTRWREKNGVDGLIVRIYCSQMKFPVYHRVNFEQYIAQAEPEQSNTSTASKKS